METLWTFGGISGFPKPRESVHDAFIAGHASNASLFEDTLYSGSFYVELELWYSVRMDEKPTDRPIDTTSNGSVQVIVTPDMTYALDALAAMGVETPTTARGF